LQNDSFPEKKNPPKKANASEGNCLRGYVNGSHSEIEVAQEPDWTPEAILNRGMRLLAFMEKRWDIVLSDEQKSQLLHLDFISK
jgi:hypothetical protein